MVKDLKQNSTKESILYSNILLLSRNIIFYTKFDLGDTFQNRIHLIFLHISFIFNKVKHNTLSTKYKIFYQKVFDIIFNQIELNMRELGYGDVSVNKNMKLLVKSFYNILLYCENYKLKTDESKGAFFAKYLELNNKGKMANNAPLIKYFNTFHSFCFDLNSDSVLKGKLNFNYK